MNVAKYTDYFRQLAVSHSKLVHDPTSETGDAPIGSKHFGRFGAEEVIQGLQSKVDWPALLIEMYENKMSSTDVYSVRGNYAGAFSIFATANPENLNEVEAAFLLTENIMMDCLAKIWQDHYGSSTNACTTPFAAFNFDGVQITPVGPVFDRQFGWRCEFTFDFNHLKNITTAPLAGVFV